MADLIKGTRVSIELFHPSVHPRVNGVIISVRDDGRGRPVYTLSLDKEWTEDGIFYARAEELRILDGTPCA